MNNNRPFNHINHFVFEKPTPGGNCPNCGAPMVGSRCQYCGTSVPVPENVIDVELLYPGTKIIRAETKVDLRKWIFGVGTLTVNTEDLERKVKETLARKIVQQIIDDGDYALYRCDDALDPYSFMKTYRMEIKIKEDGYR